MQGHTFPRQDAGATDGTDILGLTADSRAVAPGFLFAALPGSHSDGRDFIADAARRGAIAVLGEPAAKAAAGKAGLTFIADANPRRRLALMAALFHGRQPATVAAITGTNGKTSTAVFTRQIWDLLGVRAASLGTLGLTTPDGDTALPLTTLDPVTLHATLADLVGEGVDHLALEASSHGLDQYRLDGVRVTAAAFTNLSRDHLDYHPDMASYLAAKARLFEELVADGGAVVLNADAPEYNALAGIARDRGLRLIGYGRSADPDTGLRLERLGPRPDGLDMTFTAFGRQFGTSLGLIGDFQALNVLCAVGLVVACNGDHEATPGRIAGLLPRLTGAPGRLESVATAPDGGAVCVDYAHTPGALEAALMALRPHTPGRLVCVFGCGGDRDPGKRPMMGGIVARLADRAIVTDDNPRGEDPAAIRAAVLAACPGAEECADREQAIALGMAGLGTGDLLLIAGKGHETGQTIGDRVLPFEDAAVARRLAGQSPEKPL